MLDVKVVTSINNDRMRELGEAADIEAADALADLSVAVSENSVDLTDTLDAIAELSEIVSTLVIGGGE